MWQIERRQDLDNGTADGSNLQFAKSLTKSPWGDACLQISCLLEFVRKVFSVEPSSVPYHLDPSSTPAEKASIFRCRNHENHPLYLFCSSFFIQSFPVTTPRQFALPHLHASS
jgi:hypothetical protein